MGPRPSSTLRVATALLVAAALGCGRTREIPVGRSIVLVSVDTLRSDRLPAYGYGGVSTPHVDALRADGVLFEHAYSPAPLTLPAHASLLTGLLPPEHGVRDNAGYRLAETAGPTVAELLRARGYATGGAVSSFVLRGETGIGRGFEVWDDRLEAADRATIAQIQRPGGQTLKAALDWVRSRAGDETPFFLFFHIYEPHTPYEPPPPFDSRYAGSPYDGEIAASDRIVGDLLDGLRELGLYDEATVILLSDHGEGLGDHGEDEHGILVYRESLQVPLILKLPGASHAGASVATPVQLTDVAATLLELSGAEVPPRLAGTSLLDLLGDTPGAEDRVVYSESFHPRIRFGWSGLVSVIRGHHHYIEGADRELYDLAADPGERRNLARDERRLSAELRSLLAGLDVEPALPFEEDTETREALAALGYLGGGAKEGEGPADDPRMHLEELTVLRRGVDLLQAGETEKALPLLRSSSEAIPRSIDAWQFLGLALQQSRQPAAALEAYERAFELSNGSPSLAEPMADLALRLGRTEDGLVYLRLAIEHQPDDPDLRQVETRALLFAGRLDEALASGQAAVEVAPGNPGVLHLLGAVRMARGELEAAEASLRDALARDPGFQPALSDLAVLLASQGRRGEAKELLERLLALQPENPAAREMLSRLEAGS